jgi:hypothetical protein
MRHTMRRPRAGSDLIEDVPGILPSGKQAAGRVWWGIIEERPSALQLRGRLDRQ